MAGGAMVSQSVVDDDVINNDEFIISDFIFCIFDSLYFYYEL